ncbi:uncharacterized protein LOC142223556 [Haematobia irritans]|uniref:uncharacterized protein LOC142223556 n=1 Tax=Haematobia irritans TaxID=7368 RepID=UPI003F5062DC
MSAPHFNFKPWHPAAKRSITFKHTWEVKLCTLANCAKMSPLFAVEGYTHRKFQALLDETHGGLVLQFRGEPTNHGPIEEYRWKCFIETKENNGFCVIEEQCGKIMTSFKDDTTVYKLNDDILLTTGFIDKLRLVFQIRMTTSIPDDNGCDYVKPMKIIEYIKIDSEYKEIAPLDLPNDVKETYLLSPSEPLRGANKVPEDLSNILNHFEEIGKYIQTFVKEYREKLQNACNNELLQNDTRKDIEKLVLTFANLKKDQSTQKPSEHETIEEMKETTDNQLNVDNAIDTLKTIHPATLPEERVKIIDFIVKNISIIVTSEKWKDLNRSHPQLVADIFKYTTNSN